MSVCVEGAESSAGAGRARVGLSSSFARLRHHVSRWPRSQSTPRLRRGTVSTTSRGRAIRSPRGESLSILTSSLPPPQSEAAASRVVEARALVGIARHQVPIDEPGPMDDGTPSSDGTLVALPSSTRLENLPAHPSPNETCHGRGRLPNEAWPAPPELESQVMASAQSLHHHSALAPL